MESNGKRVAIVAGLRTPFAKQWSAYREVSALDLANIVVSEMLQRIDLDPKEIQQLVYGQVVPSVEAPNIAREIVLATDELSVDSEHCRGDHGRHHRHRRRRRR